ncbi:beta-N-acetylhexosaminidase [Oscillatoria laete-virens NRMC-F 0139]|nr:beta-N-acetylhexosaminidase [Oscillatoria laete-virens]MDL5055079.1 beta-N-acetylhexosaminidase [Oscillatoria laete-virens NRMC-F 0139]
MAHKHLSSIGQNFVVGLPKAELDLDTRTYLRAIRPAGIILFARNIASPAAVAELNAGVRELLGDDVLICLDHEGGRVNRIKEFLGVIPSAQQLGLTEKPALAREHGIHAAKVMRLLGFNWDLCPVVDLALKREVDNSVSDRTWSADPAETIEFAGAFAGGLLAGGVLPCGKHFPGYGSANKDPHFHLPLVDRTRKQLLEIDLLPYTALNRRKLIPSVMIGHGHFPAFHKDPFPASISKTIIQGLLRDRLGYQGAVVTDDLEMGAITKMLPIEESAVKTLQAGSDLVLICHTPSIMLQAFEAVEKACRDGKIPEKTLAISQKRVAKFKAMTPKAVKYSDKAFAKIKADTARFTQKVFGQLPQSHRVLQTHLSAVGEAYKK